MRIAVIDIGSNTVKMAIFDYTPASLRLIMSTTKHLGLVSYIENGLLSNKGIRVLSDTVADLASEAGRNSCFNIFPFATASLRKASNCDEVIKRVKDETSYTIDLISGVEEATHSFEGIVSTVGDTMPSHGFAFDMGGGSTEIIEYSNGKIVNCVSLDIGVLALYTSHVKRMIPSTKECAKLKKYTAKAYKTVDFLKGAQCDKMYMIGGTGRAAAKLHASLSKRPFTLPYTVSRDELASLLEGLTKDGEHSVRIAAIRDIPSRIHTLSPGLCAIISLMDACKAKKLVVTDASVREGYVKHIAQKNGLGNA